MSELLLENLEKYVHLEKEEKQQVLAAMHPRKLRKRQYFLQEGDVSTHSAYVLSGCIRTYFIDRNGFEHILQFAIEGWWASDLSSFIYQQPGRLNIDALEDSELLTLSRADQLALCEQCPKMEKYFRILSENSLASHQNRLLENLSLPARERYVNFVKRYPLFMQRLPQNQVAAYLGITPEFLSKIRHQMAKAE